MANLGPQKQSTSYLGLLQVPDGLTTVLKNVTDGLGASSPLQLSTTSIGFSSLTMTGPINMGGYHINNLGAPFFSTDAATKAYVDSIATGLQPKTQCVAGSVSDITLSGEQTIDDVSVVAGDRVLVKNQSIQANNGIYIVSASAWTRSSDADTWAEIAGAYVFVVSGTVNAATSWVCNSPANGTLGSTAITWIKFSSSTSTLANYLTFDAQGDGDQGYTDIATENGYNILTEIGDYLTIQTPGTIQFNGSSPVLISYNSIGAIALDGSNVSPGSTWNIDITGNAGSVTNGVYTSGSYLDPAWITGLASTKLIGAVPVNLGGTGANSLSGILLGNGVSPVSTATAADIVSTIGSTPVANATNAVNATNATNASTALVATTTTQTNFSNLTINGSQVLDAANYSSYISQTYIDVATVFGSFTSAAIQSAINTYPNRTLYLRAGNWTINSAITVSSPIILVGDGTDSTLLIVSINTDVFTVTTNGGCVFRDFAIGNLSAQLTGGSIFLFNGASGNQRTVFDHISFYNIYYGIRFVTANVWTIRCCYFTIYNTAISISNTDNDAGDSTITECIFNANSITQGTAIYQDSSGGLRVINNKFLNGLYHYIGQYNTPVQNTSIFVFVGNSSEGAKLANLAFNTSSYPFQGINITGNQFSIGGSFGGSTFTTSYGIQFVGNSISDVMIGSNEFNGSASGQVIYFGGSGTNITVGTNTFNGTGGTGSGAAIGVGAGNPDIYFLPQNILGYSSRYAGSSTNVVFTFSAAQQGRIRLASSIKPFVTISASAGTIYATDFYNISFTPAFKAVPTITATINSLGGGSATCIPLAPVLRNVSTTGFDIGAYCYNSSGECYIEWKAEILG